MAWRGRVAKSFIMSADCPEVIKDDGAQAMGLVIKEGNYWHDAGRPQVAMHPHCHLLVDSVSPNKQ